MRPAEASIPRSAEVAYLITALGAFRAVVAIEQIFSGGNEAEARSCLAQLSRDLGHLIPGLERITASQLQTAQARHLTESTIARVLSKTAEHPNTPANDHRPAPPQPAPSIA